MQSNQLWQSGHVTRVARALTASAATIFLVVISSTQRRQWSTIFPFPAFTFCVCVSAERFHNGFLCRLRQGPCQRWNVIRVEYSLRFCVDILLLWSVFTEGAVIVCWKPSATTLVWSALKVSHGVSDLDTRSTFGYAYLIQIWRPQRKTVVYSGVYSRQLSTIWG